MSEGFSFLMDDKKSEEMRRQLGKTIEDLKIEVAELSLLYCRTQGALRAYGGIDEEKRNELQMAYEKAKGAFEEKQTMLSLMMDQFNVFDNDYMRDRS